MYDAYGSETVVLVVRPLVQAAMLVQNLLDSSSECVDTSRILLRSLQ